jgi:hypothetical protein
VGEFLHNVGVSLLFVGLVNLGILVALRGLIENPLGNPTNAPTAAMVEQLRAAIESLERRLPEPG